MVTFNVERDVETVGAFLILDGEVIMAAVVQFDTLDTQSCLVTLVALPLLNEWNRCQFVIDRWLLNLG